jgi:hypothetical protein
VNMLDIPAPDQVEVGREFEIFPNGVPNGAGLDHEGWGNPMSIINMRIVSVFIGNVMAK